MGGKLAGVAFRAALVTLFAAVLVPARAAAGVVPTSTALASSANPSAAGAPVTLTATVQALDLLVTPSGTVTFRDGVRTLGEVGLAGLCPALGTTCTVRLPVAGLAPGTHAITATYGGDLISGRSSGSLEEVVALAPPDFWVVGARSLSVNRGGTSSATIVTAALQGARGVIDLSIAGLPVGAAARLSPASVRAGGASTLTVDAGTAPYGRYELTVTGTELGITHVARVLLVVAPPAANDFAMRLSTESVTVVAGQARSVKIATRASRGRPRVVRLAVSGVPAGATATLQPHTVKAGSSATLTVDPGTAAAGEFAVTVTGTEASAPERTAAIRAHAASGSARVMHDSTFVVIVGSPITDHGGKVVPFPVTYAIWWGNQGAFPADAKAGVGLFLKGLTHSILWMRYHAGPYMRGSDARAFFGGTATDTTVSPSWLTLRTVELQKIIDSSGWVAQPNDVFFIYASTNAPAGYCARYDPVILNGAEVEVALIPAAITSACALPNPLLPGNTYTPTTRALVNLTSTTFLASITNPEHNGWYDAAGQDVAGKCGWSFGNASIGDSSTGISTWELQKEWGPYAPNGPGCSMYSGGG